MKILLKTYQSKVSAKMAQGLLKSNGIDSVVSPGGENGAATMCVITGLDSTCQLFIRDTDFKKAKEILGIEG